MDAVPLAIMKAGFLCGLLAIAFPMPAPDFMSETVMSAAGFDAPLKKEVIDFGPSPYYLNPRTAKRIELSCFYFLTFMVKEYDEGQKGAEWLAIVPNGKGGAAPACTRSHAPGELVIKWPEWAGYFLAVKANLVFFHGDDGAHGGMQFAVFDSRTGKKIFEDVAYDSEYINRRIEVFPFDRLRVSGNQDGSMSLKYLRVEPFECDLYLPAERVACWKKIRAQAGIRSEQIPACNGYEEIRDPYGSAVAYPVEVSLLPRPTRRTIAGPVACWPTS